MPWASHSPTGYRKASTCNYGAPHRHPLHTVPIVTRKILCMNHVMVTGILPSETEASRYTTIACLRGCGA